MVHHQSFWRPAFAAGDSEGPSTRATRTYGRRVFGSPVQVAADLAQGT